MCKLKYFFVVLFVCLSECIFADDTFCNDVLMDGKKHYNSGNYQKAQDCFNYVKKTCGDDFGNVRYWIEKCRKALAPAPSSVKVPTPISTPAPTPISTPPPFLSVSESIINCNDGDTVVSIIVNSNIAWGVEELKKDSMYSVMVQNDTLKVHITANMLTIDRENSFEVKSIDGKFVKKIVLKQIGRKIIPELLVDKTIISCSHQDTVVHIPVMSNVPWEIDKPIGEIYSVQKDTNNVIVRILSNKTTSPRKDSFSIRTMCGEKVVLINLNQKTESLIFNVDNVEFKMVYVKGGNFVFGDTLLNKNGRDTSFVLEDYYLGETEVTQALYNAVMGETIKEQRDKENKDFRLYGVGDDYPMYYVSWSEAKNLCERLNFLLKDSIPKGYKFSLPNEVQWKFAAKGGNNSLGYKYAGSNIVDSVAWFRNNTNLLNIVGTKQCNELGLYDMSGNVAECVQKNMLRYKSNSNKGWFCYCGGSWESPSNLCEVMSISHYADYSPYDVGIRLALSKAEDEHALTFDINGVNFNMVYVEGGVFERKKFINMGVSNTLSKYSVKVGDYYIGETEVTQALWNAVMGESIQEQRDKENKNLRLYGIGDNHPMYYISWIDANEFCKKLNDLLFSDLPEGCKFMLPTAVEWEFAARSGNMLQTSGYAGDHTINKVAWFSDNSNLESHRVREKKSNELGIYDMCGNVAEWTSYYTCGGSWIDKSDDCRISNYKYCKGNSRYNCVGMRLVLKNEKQKEEILNFSVNDVDFKMVYVEGGEFLMGDDNDEFKNNLLHSVVLDDYYMGETEVTQAQWSALMGELRIADNNFGKFRGDSFPMFNISWYDAVFMCNKLNELLSVCLPMGWKFSLPTEAQWEFAARGGVRSYNWKYAGSNNLGIISWFRDNSDREKQFVAKKYPNELGLYDMSGNVWEWCSDWYDKDYYAYSLQRNPKGPFLGEARILRGGSCMDDILKHRVFYRNYSAPDEYSKFNGFRLSLSYHNEELKKQVNQAESQTLSFNINGVQFNMIYVEGDLFIMGTTKNDEGMYENEIPQYEVFLDSYYIGETEVTQALWKAVMDTNPSYFKSDDRPVENVSWYDCQKFIERINKLSGCKFSLPTESQWEFAARKGNDYKYSGNDKLGSVGWYFVNAQETKSVAQKRANGLGLYDMSGNVWEWCSDWYSIYTNSAKENPQGPSTGNTRVLRGGSWGDEARACRVFRRMPGFPTHKSNSIGLRLVLIDYKK